MVQEPPRVLHGPDIIREVVRRYNFEVFMLWWYDKASLRTGVARAGLDQRIPDARLDEDEVVPQPPVAAQRGIWSAENQKFRLALKLSTTHP